MVEFSKLEENYKGFINPDFSIKVGSKVINKDFTIMDLKVRMSASYDMATCEFTLGEIIDPKNGKVKDDISTTFKFGEVVDVEVGYTSNLQGVFKGYINSLAYEFSGRGPTITVECLDAKGALVNNNTWVNYGKKDIKEIVSSILNDKCSQYADISTIESDFDADEQGPYDESPEIKKETLDDYKYLVSLAKRTNNSFCVIYDKLYFCKNLQSDAEVKIKLEWGKHLISFATEHDISQQIGSVEVFGRDPYKNEDFTSTATNTAVNPKLVKDKKIVLDSPEGVTNESQAAIVAQAILDARRALGAICKATTIGLPDIKAADKVEFAGMGTGLDGTYYLTHVIHSINEQGYQTSFEGTKTLD